MELKHDAGKEAAAEILKICDELSGEEAAEALASALIVACAERGLPREEIVTAVDTVWAELEE